MDAIAKIILLTQFMHLLASNSAESADTQVSRSPVLPDLKPRRLNFKFEDRRKAGYRKKLDHQLPEQYEKILKTLFESSGIKLKKSAENGMTLYIEEERGKNGVRLTGCVNVHSILHSSQGHWISAGNSTCTEENREEKLKYKTYQELFIDVVHDVFRATNNKLKI